MGSRVYWPAVSRATRQVLPTISRLLSDSDDSGQDSDRSRYPIDPIFDKQNGLRPGDRGVLDCRSDCPVYFGFAAEGQKLIEA